MLVSRIDVVERDERDSESVSTALYNGGVDDVDFSNPTPSVQHVRDASDTNKINPRSSPADLEPTYRVLAAE